MSMKKDKDKKASAEKGKDLFSAQSGKLSKKQKVWIGIISIILLVLLLALTIFFLNRLFFVGNGHFTITAVKIDTQGKFAGYWNDPQNVVLRSEELRDEMQIVLHRDNLFALDLEEKRNELLKNHPEIQEIQLIPVLPDLLQIRVAERLPVARLDRVVKEDSRLIDKDGFIFAAKYYSAAKSLPFIADETAPSPTDGKQMTIGQQTDGDGTKFLLNFINVLKNEFQFEVISARIVNDISRDNYGKCIKTHLKKEMFDCKNVIFYFPKDGTVNSLKQSCKQIKMYAEGNPRVELKSLLSTGTSVTVRE